jgi:hypothetical protein
MELRWTVIDWRFLILLFLALSAVTAVFLAMFIAAGRTEEEQKMAGWVARTRPLTGPLSPRGPQPTVHHPKEVNERPPWPDGHIQGGTGVVVRMR